MHLEVCIHLQFDVFTVYDGKILLKLPHLGGWIHEKEQCVADPNTNPDLVVVSKYVSTEGRTFFLYFSFSAGIW